LKEILGEVQNEPPMAIRELLVAERNDLSPRMGMP
jgi:hypothetical protein